jgi:SAM-dependent methyltransferase
MERKRGCVDRDRRFLLDRRDRFVRVPCPACAGDRLDPAFEKDGFSYERCRDCGTVLMNPRADQALMHEFYAGSANYAFWNRYVFPATEEARRSEIFRPRAERLRAICERQGLGGGTALEVGAGFGTFCEELQRLAIFDRVIALEPTPDLARTCREKGLDTIESPVERCDLPDASMALVAAFEVLEHLFCPADFIASAARLLRGGGLLVLSCPNVHGFDIATLGTLSNSIDHEHVNYFHPQSITLLLRRFGLRVVEVLTPGKLDADLVRKAADTGRIDLSGQPFLHRVLLQEWDRLGEPFQEFLAAHNLSSHMWAVAQR